MNTGYGVNKPNPLLQDMVERDYPCVDMGRSKISEPLCRPTTPLVEHIATINGRLESIENGLEVVRAWLVGPSPECDEPCSPGDANLESQIYKADRIVDRIEFLVNSIRNRLS